MIKQPDIRPVKESGKLYMLNEPYDFTFKGVTHTIPRGFRYDGASVPKWAYTITGLLPDGIHRPAALVHDYLYEKGGCLYWQGKKVNYKRKDADKVFKTLLQKLGLKSWHIFIAYNAVKVGGRRAWEKKVVKCLV